MEAEELIREKPSLMLFPADVRSAVVRTRAPQFALATALTTGVYAWLASLGGSWVWSAVLFLVTGILVWWQVTIIRNVPVLAFYKTFVTVSRYKSADAQFDVNALKVAEGNFRFGVLFLFLACVSILLIMSGITSSGLQPVSLSALLHSPQRLLLSVAGLWIAAMTCAWGHPDFPRRKLQIKSSPSLTHTFYFADRNQRSQLLKYLRAIHLEQVQVQVGLDPTTGADEFRQRGPFSK